MLQTEVSTLKAFLRKVIDEASAHLSTELKFDLQSAIDMPEVLSPGRSFMQVGAEDDNLMKKYTTNPASSNLAGTADMLTTNHDFLAQLPYSPGRDSDCNVSDLSSSFWSARISVKIECDMAHEKHKLVIPMLDLTNLPPDSDDEDATK